MKVEVWTKYPKVTIDLYDQYFENIEQLEAEIIDACSGEFVFRAQVVKVDQSDRKWLRRKIGDFLLW